MAKKGLLSPSKVNLLLKVLRRREDGYHDILSVIQPITLYDELYIEVGRGDGITIETDHPSLPKDHRNLAFRAVELFLKRTGIKAKVKVKIKKTIPIAAGLGGGSSNAATVLMGLNELLRVGLVKEELMGMGLSLGSDVPFFTLGRPAIATGRGERLNVIDLPRFWYVLIYPGFQVSTGWVYSLLTPDLIRGCRDRQNLDLTNKMQDISIIFLKDLLNDPLRIKDVLINNLEEVTLERYPDVKEAKMALLGSGAQGALMSGSGPTVFGIFLEEYKAKKALGSLKEGFKDRGWSFFLAQGM